MPRKIPSRCGVASAFVVEIQTRCLIRPIGLVVIGGPPLKALATAFFVVLVLTIFWAVCTFGLFVLAMIRLTHGA